MENNIVAYETRICPKPLMPAGTKTDTHVAFIPVEQTENPQWSVCLLKDGKQTIFPSKDHNSADQNNPWCDAWANVYRDYCHYYGNSEIGYRRKRERIVKINGIMLDFDCHSTKDMPLEQIAKILLSDEFAQEIPYAKIVMTGNGYQVHMPICVNIGMDTVERTEKLKKYRTTISALMVYFQERWGLNPDESCKDPNRLHRVDNTWNTKSVQNFNDSTARKKVEIVKTKEVTIALTHEFLHKIVSKHVPKEIETKPRQQNETAGAQEVKEALNYINPVTLHYGDWLKIGMALKSWDEENGLALWDEWSQKDPERYDSNEIDNKWESFSAEGEVTLGTLFYMAMQNGWKRKPKSSVLPIVYMPGNDVKITTTGAQLGKLLAGTKNIYRRGRVVFRLQENDFGTMSLCDVTSSEACSLFEHVAELKSIRKNEIIGTIASSDKAEKILACPDFLTQIPRITLVVNCPILVERKDGTLEEITGYDAATGILSYGKPTEDVSLEEAVKLLKQIISEFEFLTPNDRARALASFISPALVFGRLINTRAPIDTTEGDKTQAGKGFRNKLIAAIYNDKPVAINVKKNGIGGLEESFDTALIRGKPFIALDNIRGKVESQKIESYMTEDVYQARMIYQPDTEIEPKRHVILMTTNKAELNKDMAERTVITSIRKRPDDYAFTEYPEGNIRDHIIAHQQKYLGAVYAVVRTWHKAGKPKTKVNIVSSYTNWFGIMEWILTNILGEESIVQGYRENQQRTTNPLLGWIRDIALAVKEYKKLGKEMRTIELLDIIETCGLEIPFVNPGYDLTNEDEKRKILQLIGKKLHPVFADGAITVDGFRIDQTKRSDGKHDNVTYYRFSEIQNNEKTPISTDAPCSSPEVPPEKVLISPEAPEGLQLLPEEISLCNICVSKDMKSSGGLGGIKGFSGEASGGASGGTDWLSGEEDRIRDDGFTSNLYDGVTSNQQISILMDPESSSSSLDLPF